MNNYKVTVGTEVHLELKTNTKMFSSSLNQYGKMANTLTNVVDLGYPGALPTINKKGVELALKAAILLNCEINKEMHFDRKNYFYPDNPKNFQITQDKTPIGVNGYLMINLEGKEKKIRIHDIHMEEDTAKSIHSDDSSLLDYNRAGVPLIEIVSEADIASSEEAILYLEKLREIMLYADISDCKIEEGSMRCDCNVSVSKTDKWGTKIEVKNIGSISNVGLAIEIEKKRQIELLEKGEILKEETRRFDDKENKTILMRVKETGNDYRYLPEPDIPMLVLTDEYINEVKKDIPPTADERRKTYLDSGILPINVEKIIQNRKISDYLLNRKVNLVIASNLLLGDIANYLNKTGLNLEDTKCSDEKFDTIVKYLEEKKINNKIFKDIIDEVMETDLSVDQILEKNNIKEMSDDELVEIINQVLSENEKSVKEYKEGNERAIKYLMGQAMKMVKSNANPEKVNEIIVDLLSKN